MMMTEKNLNYPYTKIESFVSPVTILSFLVALTMMIGPMSHVSLAGKVSQKRIVPQVNKKIVNKLDTYKKRLESLLAPVDYHYVAAGKPDPFKPFLRTEMRKGPAQKTKALARKPERCDTALECMDVGQLTLVGIVLEPDGNALAMAQDASGIGYTLRLGTRIGYSKGQVVSISRDKVIVKEKVEDLKGQPTFRDRILYLHPEEGDESR